MGTLQNFPASDANFAHKMFRYQCSHSLLFIGADIFQTPLVHRQSSRVYLQRSVKYIGPTRISAEEVQMCVGDVSDFWGGVSKEFCVRRLSN